MPRAGICLSFMMNTPMFPAITEKNSEEDPFCTELLGRRAAFLLG